jgi:hypothetical protein
MTNSFVRCFQDLLITRAEAAAKAANQPLQKDAIPGDERTVVDLLTDQAVHNLH